MKKAIVLSCFIVALMFGAAYAEQVFSNEGKNPDSFAAGELFGIGTEENFSTYAYYPGAYQYLSHEITATKVSDYYCNGNTYTDDWGDDFEQGVLMYSGDKYRENLKRADRRFYETNKHYLSVGTIYNSRQSQPALFYEHDDEWQNTQIIMFHSHKPLYIERFAYKNPKNSNIVATTGSSKTMLGCYKVLGANRDNLYLWLTMYEMEVHKDGLIVVSADYYYYNYRTTNTNSFLLYTTPYNLRIWDRYIP